MTVFGQNWLACEQPTTLVQYKLGTTSKYYVDLASSVHLRSLSNLLKITRIRVGYQGSGPCLTASSPGRAATVSMLNRFLL